MGTIVPWPLCTHSLTVYCRSSTAPMSGDAPPGGRDTPRWSVLTPISVPPLMAGLCGHGDMVLVGPPVLVRPLSCGSSPVTLVQFAWAGQPPSMMLWETWGGLVSPGSKLGRASCGDGGRIEEEGG